MVQTWLGIHEHPLRRRPTRTPGREFEADTRHHGVLWILKNTQYSWVNRSKVKFNRRNLIQVATCHSAQPLSSDPLQLFSSFQHSCFPSQLLHLSVETSCLKSDLFVVFWHWAFVFNTVRHSILSHCVVSRYYSFKWTECVLWIYLFIILWCLNKSVYK